MVRTMLRPYSNIVSAKRRHVGTMPLPRILRPRYSRILYIKKSAACGEER
jgi:hypothetical protein